LEEIAKQSYKDIEIVISDDNSTDETTQLIENIKDTYKYPIIYYRHDTNIGYDKNLRTSIELASGDYAITLGNDDTINPLYDLSLLVQFLEAHNYPDIGFTNFIEAATDQMEERASMTGIIGTGHQIAFSNYSRFSFVGGLVWKRNTYMRFNSPKFDGSVYTQIYHASLIVAKGGVLFSIASPVVIKDVLPLEQNRASFLDKISTKWSDLKQVTGGLPKVITVTVTAFEDAGVLTQEILFGVLKKIYTSTLPFWIITYRKNKALPEALGLALGMNPKNIQEFQKLQLKNKIKIGFIYRVFCLSALAAPVFLFEHFKVRLWKWSNKSKIETQFYIDSE
jgi:glycosyltransferase involved in cell wall biosynthesis